MVDPTALNKQNKQQNKQPDSKNTRAFLFSLLGALAGAGVCLIVDYFVGNIAGIVYLFIGIAACAFYQYFLERQDQKKRHFALLVLACLLVSALAVFFSSMILYASKVAEPEMNLLQKTFELYRINIGENGFENYIHTLPEQGTAYFDFSLLSFHTVCAVMSLLGLGLSWLFVTLSSKSWEKKHTAAHVDYSYASRQKRKSKKRR